MGKVEIKKGITAFLVDEQFMKDFDSGDVSIEITVLPNVPMRFALLLADDEFKATATIIFDYSATKELHVEELGGLCSFAVDKFIRVAK